MNKLHVGIDIGKLEFFVSVKIREKYRSKSFNNSQKGFNALLGWLKQHQYQHYHCAIESTGKYGDNLALFLHENNCLVSIINPAKIKYFMKSQLIRNKTDVIDARSIRDYCELFNPSLWKPLSTEIRILQAFIKRVDTLNNILLQEQNRLENVDPVIQDSICHNINHLKAEIKRLNREIEEHINNAPDLKKNAELIRSIPGIGEKTTTKILAFLGNLESFPSARKAAAFVGLNPQHAQSGTSLNYSHLSKTGDADLRKSFYMPALVAIQRQGPMKQFYEKLVSKGKPKKVAICAVMRKLIHIIYGVLKSQTMFDEKLMQK